MVTIFPFIALVPILRLFPPRFTGASYWEAAAAFYALAKLLEFFDEKVFSLGSIVSGHTLKHLAAAAAGLQFCDYFRHGEQSTASCRTCWLQPWGQAEFPQLDDWLFRNALER
jgi:hypothetical protein